jgi:hypothetical protein
MAINQTTKQDLVPVSSTALSPCPIGPPTGGAFSFYTVEEVGQILKVAPVTVTKWFANYPGVLDLGTQENVRLHKRGKRLLRISQSVLEKFIRENSRTR